MLSNSTDAQSTSTPYKKAQNRGCLDRISSVKYPVRFSMKNDNVKRIFLWHNPYCTVPLWFHDECRTILMIWVSLGCIWRSFVKYSQCNVMVMWILLLREPFIVLSESMFVTDKWWHYFRFIPEKLCISLLKSAWCHRVELKWNSL